MRDARWNARCNDCRWQPAANRSAHTGLAEALLLLAGRLSPAKYTVILHLRIAEGYDFAALPLLQLILGSCRVSRTRAIVGGCDGATKQASKQAATRMGRTTAAAKNVTLEGAMTGAAFTRLSTASQKKNQNLADALARRGETRSL